MANADTLARAGISGPVAIEIARQMTAGVGNGSADKLIRLGVPPMLATELTAQINAGAFTAHKLTVAGWNSAVAKLIKEHSGL